MAYFLYLCALVRDTAHVVLDQMKIEVFSDLLEKSRVVKQAPGERCYHIFYQIMSGAIDGLKQKLFLDKNDLRHYHFVSQAELTIDGVDDNEEMRMTDASF